MPFKLSAVLSIAVAVLKDLADLVAENVALRHQLSCLMHRGPRPRVRPVDRVFWVLLSRFLPPRVHGELLKLGIEISEITVSRTMPKRPAPAGSRQR
jgi:hypothetical protein